MSRDATGIYSKMATALTRCPTCKAKKGATCDMTVEGYQEHDTHFARTEQPISSAKQRSYLHPDDKYKKDLVVVGALGVLEGRTPAYVEAVAVDALGRRWAWGKYGYEYPEDFDPSDICMTPLPCFKADRRKHVLLFGPEELRTLSAWTNPPKVVAHFVNWLNGPRDDNFAINACSLHSDSAAWLASPTQSEATLKYLGWDLVRRIDNPDLDPEEVERLAWQLQRCARGATLHMAIAALSFESIERMDLSKLMARACVATSEEWKKAKRRAQRFSKRWISRINRLNREKGAFLCGQRCNHGATTLKCYLAAEEPKKD
jgi:hypothetical protein